jgi:hypothetical protein
MLQPPAKKTPVLLNQGQRHVSLAAHHNQALWQIFIPLGVAVAAILALLVGVIITAASPTPDVTNLSRWADTSMIFLSTPVIVGCFFIVVVVAALVYLMARLLKLLPPYTQLAQAYVYYASSLVRYWFDRIVSPVISLRGYWAGFQVALIKIKKGI